MKETGNTIKWSASGKLCGKGDWFIGTYENDKKHGLGLFYDNAHNKQWVGYWREGKENGKGILIDNTGKRSKGEWKEGVKIKSYDDKYKDDFDELEEILDGKNEVFEKWKQKNI